jgi:hypothetical protein
MMTANENRQLAVIAHLSYRGELFIRSLLPLYHARCHEIFSARRAPNLHHEETARRFDEVNRIRANYRNLADYIHEFD